MCVCVCLVTGLNGSSDVKILEIPAKNAIEMEYLGILAEFISNKTQVVCACVRACMCACVCVCVPE